MDYIEKEAKINPLWGDVREKILAERIIRRIKTNSIKRLADLGCGDGYLIYRLSRESKVKEFYAVDMSKIRLDRVKKSVRRIKTIRADITDLPFDQGFFDVVVCSEVLEHVKDYKKAIRELLRVTKKQLVITVPNDQQPVKTLCPRCKKLHHVAGHINKFDKETIRRLIEKSASNRDIKLSFEKFHTIYSYNSLTMKLPRFLRISFDRLLVSLEGIISFFKPNYLMVIVTFNS